MSAFIEGQTQTYTLEDVSGPVARLLVTWLYTQRVDVLQPEDYSKKEEEDLRLTELYVLANKLLITPLQNAVIELYHKSYSDA